MMIYISLYIHIDPSRSFGFPIGNDLQICWMFHALALALRAPARAQDSSPEAPNPRRGRSPAEARPTDGASAVYIWMFVANLAQF